MSKRLQVLLDEAELSRVREDAKRHGMTVSDWVRQSLSNARRREPTISAESQLRAIDRALDYEYPTADIDQMLEEIEIGRSL